MSELIVAELRALMPTRRVVPVAHEVLARVDTTEYLRRAEEVYYLNLMSEKAAIRTAADIVESQDPNARGIGWAALGNLYSSNGDYSNAVGAFDKALDEPVTGDARAYVYFQVADMVRKLGYGQKALRLLTAVHAMTANERLCWRINTVVGICQKFDNADEALTLLGKSEEYYRKTGEYFRLAPVLRHTSHVYIDQKRFRKAGNCIDEAMSIAMEHSLKEHEDEAVNDKGWLFIQQGKYDKARRLFDGLIQKELSPYHMSLALQNIGYLEFERGNTREAVRFHSQSLQLTTRYGLRDMLLEDYYKLGLCHEKLGEVALADHFFSLGYQELQEEIDLGLPLREYRRKLLDAYVAFMSKNLRIPYIDLKEQIFGFAMDKTLKDIRQVFHTALLTLHLGRTKNAPQMCKHLQIDTRTYFLYQKKLGLKRGATAEPPMADNPDFCHYLESLAPLTWKEANQTFEKDAFDYLLGKYQYNKKKLAQVLDVSYQLAVLKTK